MSGFFFFAGAIQDPAHARHCLWRLIRRYLFLSCPIFVLNSLCCLLFHYTVVIFLAHHLTLFSCLLCRVYCFSINWAGMLAGWFRLKYPNIVDGAIAASAPIVCGIDELQVRNSIAAAA